MNKMEQEIIQECKQLSPAYTYTRYPDVTPIKNIKELEWLEKKI